MKYILKLLLVSMLILGVLFSSCTLAYKVNIDDLEAAAGMNQPTYTGSSNSNDENGGGSGGKISGKLNDYGIGSGGNGVDDEITDKTNAVLGAIQVVGYLIAAGMIVFIGVRYIIASGDEKSDLKTAMPKYVMGAILIIFCDIFAGFIFKLFE